VQSRRAIVLIAATAALAIGMLASLIGASVASAASPEALVLGTSVTTFTATDGSERSLEQQQAEADGFGVTVVGGPAWEAMTAPEFAKYQVLIIGDPVCKGDEGYAPAQANAKVWQPVVMARDGPHVPQQRTHWNPARRSSGGEGDRVCGPAGRQDGRLPRHEL
jgi:hypothetical protein